MIVNMEYHKLKQFRTGTKIGSVGLVETDHLFTSYIKIDIHFRTLLNTKVINYNVCNRYSSDCNVNRSSYLVCWLCWCNCCSVHFLKGENAGFLSRVQIHICWQYYSYFRMFWTSDFSNFGNLGNWITRLRLGLLQLLNAHVPLLYVN